MAQRMRSSRTRRGGLRAVPSLVSALAVAVVAVVAADGARALPTTDLWLSEVMFNPSGGDNGREWVEIYNAGPTAIDLASYSLGWGTTDYTDGVFQLSGVVAPGQYFVVGGPTSDGGNGNPVFDLAADLAPDLPNPFLVSAGVALFDVAAASITAATTPVHAVVYGGFFGNLFGLQDETGAAATPVGASGAGESLAFDGAGWNTLASPSPGVGSLPVPVREPAAAGLLALTLASLATRRRV